MLPSITHHTHPNSADSEIKPQDHQNTTQDTINMATQFDPWAQVFNLSREYILSSPTPPIQIADIVSQSTTRSTYRLHWNTIAFWGNFGDLVQHYWNNVVTQADKQQFVFTQDGYRLMVQTLASGMSIANEDITKVCIDTFPVAAAANGLNGAPRPSDQHSKLERCRIS